jgi:hypothetical protein
MGYSFFRVLWLLGVPGDTMDRTKMESEDFLSYI